MGGKTAIRMRSDLRTDLKDSGSLWSNAELDRCVEKIYADLSRFLPQEKIYEESLQFTVSAESITSLATTSLIAICNAVDINVAAPADLAIVGQPDKPRPLTLTMTDANSSCYGVTFTVKGLDKDGYAVSEIFHYSRGGSKTMVGKKEFKYVYSVTMDSNAGSGAGDVLSVGYGLTTSGWIYLAYKPIRYQSETVTSSPAGTTYTRDTDYTIDYANGRIKLLTGGSMAASTAYLVSYTKDKLTLDITNIADFIRAERVEYIRTASPPQSFVDFNQFGKYIVVTGEDISSQEELTEDYHIRLYYAAEHLPPNDYTPGTVPEFLENTILMGAAAYALLIYSLKQEHQAATDFASARTALTAADTGQTALGTALANVKKYLDNNSSADAAGILQDITDDATNLRTAIQTALAAAAADLAAVVAASTGDLSLADATVNSYIGTTNYVTKATAPSVDKYLADGDAFLNTVNVGGEQQEVPEAYRRYAQTVTDGIIRAYENHRAAYQQNATARTNAALALVQEAAQRVANLRSYIEQSAGYSNIAAVFAREAEARIQTINDYLQESNGYLAAANGEMVLADKFKAEAIARRDEVWSIWRDKREYIGQVASSQTRQQNTNYSSTKFV